jgi:hypothetical protein
MVALTADRNTPRREGLDYSDPVAANVTIFAGALVMLNASGNATPGTAATGQIARGVAVEKVQNGATAGAVQVKTRPGVYRFLNSASADEITRAHIGDECFIVTDSQVALTNGGSTRSVAGRVVQVDAQGVWVQVGISN